MNADYTLLGVLARGPMSGYELSKWLETDGCFLGRSPSMSPIYRALADLAQRGWTEPTTVARGSAPDAKIHRLSASGRAALMEWASSPYKPTLRPMAPDFIVRLNYAGQLGPTIALDIVSTELEFRVRQRARENGTRPETATEPIPEIDPGWLERLDSITHSRGWQSTSLFIGWLETLKSELEALIERSMHTDEVEVGVA